MGSLLYHIRTQCRYFHITKLFKSRDLTLSFGLRRLLSRSPQAQPQQNEDLQRIRNIGIMAHIDAGKTTTTERMLYYSGFTKHLGDVDDGDTVMDYLEQERQRGITITSAAITLRWKKHKINLIDTPGHVDFTVEVERCLRVLDGAVAILDASAGVEAQTLTVWRQADHYNVPRIVYLNKMDKVRANLELCLNSIQNKLHVEPIVVNIPIGIEKTFAGVIDLINMQEITWDLSKSPDGRMFESKSASQSEEVMAARNKMIGQLADLDDTIAEYVLSDTNLNEIPSDAIHKALRRVTLSHKAVIVLCGSSLKNKGVHQVLDAVTYYLPSPLDIKHKFIDYYGPNLCALAFKIIHEKNRGALTFLRLYSGRIKSGSEIFNVNQHKTEKINRLLQVSANEFKDIQSCGPGNIVCVAGFEETKTGDTLTNSTSTANAAAKLYMKERKKKGEVKEEEEEEDFDEDSLPVLATVDIPTPVFFCSIEPPSISAQRALDDALACIQREDPSLKVEVNEDTCQTILSGMGELHMDIIKNRILNEYKVDAYMGPLEIAYKETIQSESGIAHEVLDVTVGERHHHVEIGLSVYHDPNAKFKRVELDRRHGQKDAVESPIHLGNIKKYHMKAINLGVSSALRRGSILHFPVIDVSVCLHTFDIRPGTSVPMVTACASQCVTKALKQAANVLLEPIMELEVQTDGDYIGVVMRDLSMRRSQIQSVEERKSFRIVNALTPLSELMGYSTDIRSLTSGTASVSMELSHYEPMSQADQDNAIERVTGFRPTSVLNE